MPRTSRASEIPPKTAADLILKEFKWMTIKEVWGGEGRKTKCFQVIAKEGGKLLGSIEWHSGFRAYSFNPYPITYYEEDCLRDIAQFIEDQTTSHRAGWKK